MIRRGTAGAASLALAALLGACGGGGDDNGALADPATLCLTADCGTKTQLLDIPSAENMLFTPEGRLFVSGGEDVYEITRNDETWLATPLEGNCNFTGLALRGDVLYANCIDGNLYAANIKSSPIQMTAIHDFGVGAPNGMTTGPDGALYIANGPIARTSLPDPKIVRVRLDPANPMRVIEQTDWLPLTIGLNFPNGVQSRGNDIYFSESSVLPVELGAVRKVAINPDGSPGEVQTVASFLGLPDDFSLVGEHILFASYTNNQIALFSPTGALLQQSAPLSFDSPSAVRLGQPPLFAPDDLLVTEKGIIGLPPTPGYGSKLSVFRRNRP